MKNNNNPIKCYALALVLFLGSPIAQADIPDGYSVLETINYEYDSEGNRITRGATVSGVPETPIEAQYDQGNRLTQLTLKGQGQNGTDLSCTLNYDLNGNLAGKTCTDPANATSITTQYAWDSRNQLIQIQSPSVTASFQYDPLGRRIERTVNGHTTHFLYDGNQAIAELSDAGSISYLTGLTIDEVIARYTTEGERTLLTDALGSVLIAAKEDTSVSTAYGYSAYGETQVMGTDEQNPVQYTSRENDGTGLYYYRARYYDPQLNRFISEDPIGIDGGHNLYLYANAAPTLYKDPLGLTAVPIPAPPPSLPTRPNGSEPASGGGSDVPSSRDRPDGRPDRADRPDRDRPEDTPSDKPTCKLFRRTPPGGYLNPGCEKCWKCEYSCGTRNVIGGGNFITRWQPGGCVQMSGPGYVPGYPSSSECEAAPPSKPTPTVGGY